MDAKRIQLLQLFHIYVVTFLFCLAFYVPAVHSMVHRGHSVFDLSVRLCVRAYARAMRRHCE